MKLYTIVFVFLLAILFSACSNVEKKYWENGEVKSEITYKDSKREGEAVWYYDNGQIMLECHYANDMLEGQSIRRNYDGSITRIDHYSNNMLNGTSSVYDDVGNKTFEASYINDTLDGKYTSWYSNGVVQEEKEFIKGNFNGQWKWRDIHGFIVGIANYENGSGIQQAFYTTGSIKQELSIKNNIKNGYEYHFSEDGDTVLIKYFENNALISQDSI